MGMDLVEGSVSVVADLVDVGKTIEGKKHRGSAGQSQLCPEGQESWPGVFSFLCAEGQVGKGSTLLEVGEFGPVLLNVEFLKNDTVGSVKALYHLEAVNGLRELRWLSIGNRRVLSVTVG